MRALVEDVHTPCTPEALAETLRDVPELILLRSTRTDAEHGRHSFVAANPFLTLRAHGASCELHSADGTRIHTGDPWVRIA